MIDRGPATALPGHCAELLSRFANECRFEVFDIFGGAPFDLLRGRELPHDLDVAIRGDERSAVTYHMSLERNPAFSNLTPVNPYWIHLTRRIWVFGVAWRNHTPVDVSVMDHTNEAHFDVETVMWHFPDMVYTDPFGALRTEPSVRLISALATENPVLLTNRALKLSAKYGCPDDEVQLMRLLGSLAERASTWWPDDPFHGRDAHARFLRHLAEATLRSARPTWLLDLCHRSGVLAARLPALDACASASSGIISTMASCRTVDDFWAAADAIVGLPGPRWRDYEAARPDTAARM